MRTTRAIRETYNCGGCRASLRYRVLAEAVLSCFNSKSQDLRSFLSQSGADLTILEAGVHSPLRRFFSSLPGYTVAADLSVISRNSPTADTALKAPVDLIITSDVFEHIRKPMESFRDVHGALKPGGFHVFTIPTAYPLPERTSIRVNVDGDEDIPVMEPVYHGDGKGGSLLVYNDFGRELLGELARIGFITSVHNYSVKERFVRTASAFISVKAEVGSWLFAS